MADSKPCLLCGQNETAFVSDRARYGAPVTNVVCKTCGLVYIDSDKTIEELDDYYKDRYRDEYKIQDLDGPKYRATKANKAAFLARFIPAGSSVLEIGCANGTLLDEIAKLKPGVGFHAIEPDVALSKAAASNYGIDVFNGVLEDFVTEKKFNLIVLDHVIEHFLDPLDALKRLRDLLAPSGLIFIEAPNIFQPYGDFDDNFLQAAHLYTFSPKTMGILCRLAGLNVRAKDDKVVLFFFAQRAEPPDEAPIDFAVEGDSYLEVLDTISEYRKQGAVRPGPSGQ